MSLLCVLTASPRTLADVHLLSRRMLAMRASADALLALCDLPDAFAAVMPEDEPLLRALQSAGRRRARGALSAARSQTRLGRCVAAVSGRKPADFARADGFRPA